VPPENGGKTRLLAEGIGELPGRELGVIDQVEHIIEATIKGPIDGLHDVITMDPANRRITIPLHDLARGSPQAPRGTSRPRP